MDADDGASISSALEVSERETQFVPQEDDEETLWAVIEITDEKGRKYKVKWAGVDPKTKKPWPQSWVPKHDCTDGLVTEWKRKQASKKKETVRKKVEKKTSSASKKSALSRASIVSKGSTATSSTVRKRPPASNATAQPPTVSNGKHSREPEVNGDEIVSTSRPRKKRKVDEDMDEQGHEVEEPPVDSYEVKPVSKFGRVLRNEDEDEDEDAEMESVAEMRKPTQKGTRPSRTMSRRGGRTLPEKRNEKMLDEAGENSRSHSASTTSTRKTPATKRAVPRPTLRRRRMSPNGKNRPPLLPVSEDDDEEEPPPLERRSLRPTSSLRHPRLIEEVDDHIDEHPQTPLPSPPTLQTHHSPQSQSPPPPLSSIPCCLSPDAVERLRLFDAELERLKTTTEQFDVVPASQKHQELNLTAKGSSPYVVISPPVPIQASPQSRDSILHRMEDDFVNYDADLQPPEDRLAAEPHSPEVEKQPVLTLPVPSERPQLKQNRAGDDDSYRQEVVPETETESQSQSQSQGQYSRPLQRAPTASVIIAGSESADKADATAATSTTVPPKTVTPLRGSGSLISKMKPRTPGSASKFSLYDSDDVGYGYGDNVLSTVREADEAEGEGVDGTRKRPRADSESTMESDGEEQNRKERENRKKDSKVFKPIPHLSPSQFTPHLPTISTILADLEEAAAEELVSSIEQFSSPEKGCVTRRRRGVRNGKARTARGKRRVVEDERDSEESEGAKQRDVNEVSVTDQDDDSLEAVVMQRGMQLAENARREKKAMEYQLGLRVKRVVLTDLSAAARNGVKGKGKEGELKVLGFGVQSRGGSKGSGSEEIENSRTQDGEDNGPSPEGESDTERRERISIEALREEVEESTQDLLAEQQAPLEGGLEGAEVDVEMDDLMEEEIPEVHEPEEEKIIETIAEEESAAHDANCDLKSSPPHFNEELSEVHEASVEERDFDELQPQVMDLEIPSNDADLPPSREKTSSVTGRRVVSMIEVETNLVVPPTAPDASSSPVTPEPSQEDTHQDEPRHLGAALSLLNVKSQEISRLEGLFHAEQAKTAAFLKEIEALKQALEAAHVHVSHPEQAERVSVLAEAGEESAQEEAKREQDHDAVVAQVKSLTKQKESADKEVEFFREQYMKASSFVSAVRAENNELEQRACVAEQQAKTGVEAIKLTYELRLKTLEDDKNSWKRLALFVTEKDERTNDDIRRRAGEEPQLRARVEELEDAHHRLLEQTNMLQDDLESRETHARELDMENVVWKKEIVRLTEELSRVKAEFRRLEGGRRSEEDEDPDEMVYLCHWRLEDGNVDCGKAFMSIEELQIHLYKGAHLGEHLYR